MFAIAAASSTGSTGWGYAPGILPPGCQLDLRRARSRQRNRGKEPSAFSLGLPNMSDQREPVLIRQADIGDQSSGRSISSIWSASRTDATAFTLAPA